MRKWLDGGMLAVIYGTAPTLAAAQPDLHGMWSDPPATLEASFCFMACTVSGVTHLYELVDASTDNGPNDGPKNAIAYQYNHYVLPSLTEAGAASIAIDPADDPSFLHCEPWGFGRQVFAPHQLEITQLEDRVELHYGEWDVRRTVYLDGRASRDPAPTRMGHSTGRYEGSTLVVETTGVSANIAPWGWTLHPNMLLGLHSDRLRAVERYTRSSAGDLLLLTATLEDPWALREPLVLQRAWGWAPEQEIFPYEDCETPTEFKRGATR